jgi:SM-20-related protein
MGLTRALVKGSAEDGLLNFAALAEAPVVTEPFPYMAACGVVDPTALAAIAKDFPPINKPGVFPLSALRCEGAFAALIEEIKGGELQALIEQKFGVDLSDKALMITVRGQCQKRDGRIHTDSKDKVITCLLYLNDPTWNEDAGRLRLLREGDDLDSVIAEVPPNGGNFVAFKRTDNSWHGHTPFEGPRRYIMFNWLRSNAALAKNLGRHKLSAAFKRLGAVDAY